MEVSGIKQSSNEVTSILSLEVHSDPCFCCQCNSWDRESPRFPFKFELRGLKGTRRLRQIQKQQIHCNNTDATREQLYRSIWNLKVPTYIVNTSSGFVHDDESEHMYNNLFSIAEATTWCSLDVLMERNTFATVTGLASQQIKELNRRFDGKKDAYPSRNSCVMNNAGSSIWGTHDCVLETGSQRRQQPLSVACRR